MLELSGVSQSFGGLKALSNVTLRVPEQRIVGLIQHFGYGGRKSAEGKRPKRTHGVGTNSPGTGCATVGRVDGRVHGNLELDTGESPRKQ